MHSKADIADLWSISLAAPGGAWQRPFGRCAEPRRPSINIKLSAEPDKIDEQGGRRTLGQATGQAYMLAIDAASCDIPGQRKRAKPVAVLDVVEYAPRRNRWHTGMTSSPSTKWRRPTVPGQLLVALRQLLALRLRHAVRSRLNLVKPTEDLFVRRCPGLVHQDAAGRVAIT